LPEFGISQFIFICLASTRPRKKDRACELLFNSHNEYQFIVKNVHEPALITEMANAGTCSIRNRDSFMHMHMLLFKEESVMALSLFRYPYSQPEANLWKWIIIIIIIIIISSFSCYQFHWSFLAASSFRLRCYPAVLLTKRHVVLSKHHVMFGFVHVWQCPSQSNTWCLDCSAEKVN